MLPIFLQRPEVSRKISVLETIRNRCQFMFLTGKPDQEGAHSATCGPPEILAIITSTYIDPPKGHLLSWKIDDNSIVLAESSFYYCFYSL